MDKRLVFPSNIGDRRDVYFVKEDRHYLTKHASNYHPEISQYIAGATPIENLIQVLITALGAYEYWGQNVNGDRFKVPALANPTNDFGYKTFETNANYFLHHNNKDPALSKGRVLKAVWNDKAKRVELVIGIDMNLDPEGAAMIDRGESLTFSMGAKVPYDICSICSNRAKTRAEYCDHLRYQMNQIDPVTGLLVGADNTLPKFFDISRVLIPADKTAYMWTKIAGAANPYNSIGSAQLAELPAGKIADLSYLTKKAEEIREAAASKLGVATKLAVTKGASITKRIELKVSPALEDRLENTVPVTKKILQDVSPSVEPALFNALHDSGVPLTDLIKTMADLGIEPKPEEMRYLAVKYRPVAEDLVASSEPAFSDVAALALLPYLGSRSFLRPALLSRIVSAADIVEENPDLVKSATERVIQSSRSLREFVAENQRKPETNPAYIAGAVAALYLIFGKAVSESGLGSLGRFIANHPVAALPIMVPLVAGLAGAGAAAKSSVFSSRPRTTGFYNVDANLDGVYNKSWQSRFADMQARPVAVIKTGSARWSDFDPSLAKKVLYGIPAIYVGTNVLKGTIGATPQNQHGPVKRFISENPGLLSGGLLMEHLTGAPISKRISSVFKSGKRAVKTASIQNLDFLRSLPENEQELIWDIAILDAADRIYSKVSGG